MLATACALLAGCSLFVSSDGFSNGGRASDGGPTTPVNEGGAPPSDGGTLAPTDGTTPLQPFCASLSPKPTLCADFDNNALPESVFTLNGAPKIDSTIASSPPKSLIGIVETGASIRYCSVTRAFDTIPTKAKVSFKAYLDQYDASNDVELVNLAFDGDLGICNLVASVRTGSWTLDEYCEKGGETLTNVSHRTSRAGSLGRWTKIAFEVSFTSPKVFSLTIDDLTSFDATPSAPGFFGGLPTITAGVNYVHTAGTRAQIHVDDLTVDLQQ